MNNTIILPNGRVFDLERDDLTTEDYKCLSGVEVRHIRHLQDHFIKQRWIEKSTTLFKEKGILIGNL